MIAKGPLYKEEIIQLFPGMTEHDFRKWLNIPMHKQALAELGVKPTSHKLNLKAVQYVFDHY